LDVVLSGRPVVVVRGLPPLCEDVPEPDVGLPVFVPLDVGTPDPVVPVPAPMLATGTSGEGTGVEVFEVFGVSFC
jgi:hypothetical protein